MSKWLSLSKQVISYGIVGLGQITLDLLVFIGLSRFGISPGIANVVGRICGAIAGFWFNGRWTFARRSKTIGLRHLVRFAASWAVMTALSTLVVVLVDNGHGLRWAWAIKPFADAILAAAGFVVSKFWIYHHPGSEHPKDLKREAL